MLSHLLSSRIFKTIVHALFSYSRFSRTICCGCSTRKGFSTYRPCTKWVRNKIWWAITLVCGEKKSLFSIGLAVSFLWKCYIYIHNLDLCLELQINISHYLPNFSVMLLIEISCLSQNLLNFWNFVWFNLILGYSGGTQNQICPKFIPITAFLQINSCSLSTHIHFLLPCVMNIVR